MNWIPIKSWNDLPEGRYLIKVGNRLTPYHIADCIRQATTELEPIIYVSGGVNYWFVGDIQGYCTFPEMEVEGVKINIEDVKFELIKHAKNVRQTDLTDVPEEERKDMFEMYKSDADFILSLSDLVKEGNEKLCVEKAWHLDTWVRENLPDIFWKWCGDIDR